MLLIISNNGRILQGSGNTNFTTDEIASIHQELSDLRKEIKELNEQLK